MRNRYRSAVCIILILAICLSGCGGIDFNFNIGSNLSDNAGVAETVPAIDPSLGMVIDKNDIQTESSIHIRDKDLLYKHQNNTEIVTMYLTVSMGNSAENTNHTWEEINTYSAYDYEDMGVDRYKVAGLIQVGDENGLIPGELGYGQVAPNCTVQIRGQSSSLNVQKNYKISIKDNKGDWRGQTTIALNKHQGDSLRFRNKLGFDLLTEIEQLMSLRTTFVRLYVKDTTADPNAKFEDYGIYTQVEQLNKTALERHGLDKKGHLYKINFCEFYTYDDVIVPSDSPNYNLVEFEKILEVKGDDDHTKLIRLLKRINDYSIPIETILEEDLDIENLSYWMAYQLLIGNVDTQSRNFYIYSPLNGSRFYILPWDLDGMLKRTEYEIKGRNDYTEWEKGVSNYWGNILFRRCLQSELYREKLDEAVEDLYKELTDGRIERYAETYSELLKPYIFSGRDALAMPVTPAEHDFIVDSLTDEIRDNYQYYKESYEKPMPFHIGEPVLNGDKYSLTWDTAYTFNAETVAYTLEIAKDYMFNEPVLKMDSLKIPAVEFDALPAGQYFIRVTVKDAGGQTQTAFDAYTTENGKAYGIKSFYVDHDGQLAEDVYVET